MPAPEKAPKKTGSDGPVRIRQRPGRFYRFKFVNMAPDREVTGLQVEVLDGQSQPVFASPFETLSRGGATHDISVHHPAGRTVVLVRVSFSLSGLPGVRLYPIQIPDPDPEKEIRSVEMFLVQSAVPGEYDAIRRIEHGDEAVSLHVEPDFAPVRARREGTRREEPQPGRSLLAALRRVQGGWRPETRDVRPGRFYRFKIVNMGNSPVSGVHVVGTNGGMPTFDQPFPDVPPQTTMVRAIPLPAVIVNDVTIEYALGGMARPPIHLDQLGPIQAVSLEVMPTVMGNDVDVIATVEHGLDDISSFSTFM